MVARPVRPIPLSVFSAIVPELVPNPSAPVSPHSYFGPTFAITSDGGVLKARQIFKNTLTLTSFLSVST